MDVLGGAGQTLAARGHHPPSYVWPAWLEWVRNSIPAGILLDTAVFLALWFSILGGLDLTGWPRYTTGAGSLGWPALWVAAAAMGVIGVLFATTSTSRRLGAGILLGMVVPPIIAIILLSAS